MPAKTNDAQETRGLGPASRFKSDSLAHRRLPFCRTTRLAPQAARDRQRLQSARWLNQNIFARRQEHPRQ